jgi:hypothetical protein
MGRQHLPQTGKGCTDGAAPGIRMAKILLLIQ